jgi:hypothetical protein
MLIQRLGAESHQRRGILDMAILHLATRGADHSVEIHHPHHLSLSRHLSQQLKSVSLIRLPTSPQQQEHHYSHRQRQRAPAARSLLKSAHPAREISIHRKNKNMIEFNLLSNYIHKIKINSYLRKTKQNQKPNRGERFVKH